MINIQEEIQTCIEKLARNDPKNIINKTLTKLDFMAIADIYQKQMYEKQMYEEHYDELIEYIRKNFIIGKHYK